MRHLNYNHLLYFWTVAREGSVVRAAETLHLTPQTISGQLKLLEEAVGQPLFHRVGRGLALTDTGQLVKQYADEIFSLGSELSRVLKAERAGTPVSLGVGIVSSIPKLITYQILQPALELDEPVKISCTEGALETLLADLAVHRLDLVLSDRTIPHGLNVRAYNHSLGDSEIGFFAAASMADRYRADFPGSLHQAPMLLPVSRIAIRRALEEWLDQEGVSPNLIAEFDDSALMKAFGEAGAGLFPAPLAIADQICRHYNVVLVGTASGLTETYFAISPERRLRHPAIRAITEQARERLFKGALRTSQVSVFQPQRIRDETDTTAAGKQRSK